MPLGHRLTRFPRELSAQWRLFAWLMAFAGVWTLGLSIWESRETQNDDSAETDRALHHRLVGQLLEIHQIFKKGAEDECARRFLTGYLKTEEIERDIRLAYEGAFDAGFLGDVGRAEYALVRLYLGESQEEVSEYLDLEFLGDGPWPEEVQVVHDVVNGQPLPAEWPGFLLENSGIDWFTDILAWQADLTEDITFGDSWYERTVSAGTPSFAYLGVSMLFAIPCIVLLLRRSQQPLRATRRWHPSITLALTLWSLLIFQEASGFAWALANIQLFPESSDPAPMEIVYLCSILFYLLMQGGPVLVLALVLTRFRWFKGYPTFPAFGRIMGLNHFRWSFIVIILGLNGAYFLFNYAWYGLIESRLGGFDTRDFLTAGLIDSGRRGLIADLILAAVIAPVFEEIAFRGFLFTSLRNRIGPWAAALISTSIFAGLHSYSWMGLLSVAIFGLVMCWVFQKTRSLWPCIIFHAIGNFEITLSCWYSYSLETLSWSGLFH